MEVEIKVMRIIVGVNRWTERKFVIKLTYTTRRMNEEAILLNTGRQRPVRRHGEGNGTR